MFLMSFVGWTYTKQQHENTREFYYVLCIRYSITANALFRLRSLLICLLICLFPLIPLFHQNLYSLLFRGNKCDRLETLTQCAKLWEMCPNIKKNQSPSSVTNIEPPRCKRCESKHVSLCKTVGNASYKIKKSEPFVCDEYRAASLQML